MVILGAYSYVKGQNILKNFYTYFKDKKSNISGGVVY